MTIADLLKIFPPDTEIEATDGERYFRATDAVRRPETGSACLLVEEEKLA